MKLLGGIAAALVLVTGSALAADLGARTYKAPPMSPAAVAYDWSGFTKSSSIGGQWWDANGTYVLAPPVDRHRTNGSSVITGSQLGYQKQFGNWVLGVEGALNQRWDYDYASSLSVSGNCLGGSAIANRTCESRLQNYWTVGGKVGYAWDRWMVYGSGGYANGSVYTRTTLTIAPNTWTSYTKARQDGWYAGVGFDYYVMKFLWSDMIIGAEYQHIDLGTKLHVDILPGATGANNRNVKVTDDVVRAKLTFKWNPAPAAVVAKY